MNSASKLVHGSWFPSKTRLASDGTVHKKTVNHQLSTISWSLLRPGLTIVELITGIAIIGFVSFLVAAVYFAQFKLFSNQNTAIDVASENKLATDEMVNQIRESETVVNTCAACGSDVTGPSKLILRLWPLNSNGDPTDPSSSNYDYIIYKPDPSDNTKLIKQTFADTVLPSTRSSGSKIIATKLSSLQFAYDNIDPTLAAEITITITNTQNSSSKTHTYTQSVKAVLRNK